MPEDIPGSDNGFPYGEPPKRKRKRRKYHGVMYFRNLRPSSKTRFKTKVTERGDNMANVIEALMLFYHDHPEKIEHYLDEVKNNRRKSNRWRD